MYRIPGLVNLYHFFLAFLGALIYGFPSRGLFVIGVTGTKGKTTALEILNEMLEKGGHKTALVSSLYFKVGDHKEKNPTDNTMPGRFFLQGFLRKAARESCEYALVEVTSQGVALHRHRFIDWATAAILNLAPEHIEAHGSFERYRDAKMSFLKYAGGRGAKVFVNSDDASADFFTAGLRGLKVVLFSGSDRSMKLPANLDKKVYLLSNDFNRENLAMAVSVARNLGVSEKTILEVTTNFSGVPGRMEYVLREPFSVVVDYAHTPGSLKRVYQSLGLGLGEGGRLICVLGSAGGGRDRWKRPEMGRIAGEYCEEIILTDEDPYDENPKKILEEIRAGISGGKVREILDRKKAIYKAVSLARKGDVVVIIGKGSEPYIHMAGGRRVAWSDTRAALEAVNKKTP